MSKCEICNGNGARIKATMVGIDVEICEYCFGMGVKANKQTTTMVSNRTYTSIQQRSIFDSFEGEGDRK